MINLYLVKKGNLSWRKFERKLRRGWFDNGDERVVLFPENTLSEKFARTDFEEYLSQLNLDENTITFFSAFVRNKLPNPNKSSVQAFIDDDVYFRNYGYLINGTSIINYPKEVVTSYDSSNSGKGFGVEYLDVDLFKHKVDFPKIEIDGRTLEFRLCRDVECDSTNDPDIVLCSAYGLRNYQEQVKKSIGNKIAIIHDTTQSSPILYAGHAFYYSMNAVRQAEKKGIKIHKK